MMLWSRVKSTDGDVKKLKKKRAKLQFSTRRDHYFSMLYIICNSRPLSKPDKNTVER